MTLTTICANNIPRGAPFIAFSKHITCANGCGTATSRIIKQSKNELKITNEAEFNGLVNRTFPWFLHLRELTNGSKHFEAREHGFEAYRVAAAPASFDVLGAV